MGPTYIFNKDYNELWSRDEAVRLDRSIPPQPLTHSVFEHVFVVANRDNHPSPTVILPDLSPHVIIYCLQDGRYRIRLIGPRTKAIFINHTGRHTTLIFRIRPLALYHLLSFPIKELTDQGVDIDDVWGNEIKQNILARIQHKSEEDVCAYLLENIHINTPKEDRMARAFLSMKSEPVYHVNRSARSLGVSSRYLQKITNTQVGMAPKTICRIQRFLRSLALKTDMPEISSTQLALVSGYYDQSHMIDEYQQFVRKTPGEIFG